MRPLIILMTRIPEKGATKSRLAESFTAEQIQHISIELLKKNYSALKAVPHTDQVFYVTSKHSESRLEDYIDIYETPIWQQMGDDLGKRMAYAFERAFRAGYDRVVLIGSDLYDMNSLILEEALSTLNEDDLVITPSLDGGYGLIGMTAYHPELFEIEQYGDASVLDAVLSVATAAGLTYRLIKQVRDVDTPEDVARILTQDEDARFLAAGEYNLNFVFGAGRYILRMALASQMHLERQIAYEYEALRALEVSQVTPRAYGLEEGNNLFGLSYLIEAFLPGRPLDYTTDLNQAAYLLAQVHAVDPSRALHLLRATYPFRLMQEEFEHMFSIYQKGSHPISGIEERIVALWGRLNVERQEETIEHVCIINTELNSGNFLINEDGPSYIIDWEKPLLGEVEQDLAHFLAPTTTRWKTDVWLEWPEINQFIKSYNKYAHRTVDMNRLVDYLQYTCIRGLTWCAMAYVQYEEASKIGVHDETYDVIRCYLSEAFIDRLEAYFDELEERRTYEA